MITHTAAALALIIAALWLTLAYNAAYGAQHAQPLPRCFAMVGGSAPTWVNCW